MRKEIAVFLIVVVALIAWAAAGSDSDKSGYVRIRIIANSDAPFDQNLKLTVRNKLVARLRPMLKEADSREEAIALLKENSAKMEAFCNELVKDAGYGATVAVRDELFPDRTYGGETYPAGAYAALVVTLGSGEGQNWWCVAYPPLCFINGTPDPDNPDKITYRSFLIEWLAKWL